MQLQFQRAAGALFFALVAFSFEASGQPLAQRYIDLPEATLTVQVFANAEPKRVTGHPELAITRMPKDTPPLDVFPDEAKGGADAIETMKRATVRTRLRFSFAPRNLKALQRAEALVLELAPAGAVLYDEESFTLYSLDEWRRRRVDSWSEGKPLAFEHVSLGSEEMNDGTGGWEVASAGMPHFGLPDLHVIASSVGNVRPHQTAMNILIQLLAERSGPIPYGAYQHRGDAIAQPTAKEILLRKVHPGAKSATIVFEVNEISGVNIECGGSQKEPSSVRCERYLSDLLGVTDEPRQVSVGSAALEASKRARQKLIREVKPRFLGKKLGKAALFVKKAFPIPNAGDRYEYLWIAVSKWDGDELRGLIDSVPSELPAMKAGMEVTLREDEVFDYLILHPDGSSEGNETKALMKVRPE